MVPKAPSCVAAVVFATSVFWDAPRQDGPPTWAKDIAPLVHSRCTMCHTEGGHGPFALASYDDVKRRWELVRQVVLNLQMPPCGFSSDFGAFCLSSPLSDAQIVTVQDWIRAGMPEGEGAPAAPAFPVGFRLGKPDMEVRPIVEPNVPAEGNPVWRAVVIEPGHGAVLRLRGFDVVPDDARAIRHVLLAVASPDVNEDAWATNGTLDDKALRFIGAWAPGYPAFRLPEGVCLTLKPGERLVAQVLYQTIGRTVDSGFRLGLYSAGSATREAYWVSREAKDFQIPAYTDLTVTTKLALEKDVELLAILPEARFFAFAIEVRSGGKTLLQSKKWSPYWNGSFVFPRPVALAKGTEVTSSTLFENERHSPINEGTRPRLVYSGPALDQEVCRTHYLVVDR